MARGRTPKPAAIARAQGNPGKRRVAADPTSTVIVGGAAAVAPTWLSVEGKDIWNRLAPELARMNLLRLPDVQTFARYCQWFALWLKAMTALQTEDLVKTTESEHVTMDRLNKNLQAALLVERRLVDIEDRFGLNPANRQRIFALRAAGGGKDPALGLFGEDAQDDSAANKPPAPTAQPEHRGPIGALN